MMAANLFVIANVKQLRTDGSFRILLPFSEQFGVLAPYIQNLLTVFTFGLGLTRFWRVFRISGGVEHPNILPPVSHCTETFLELKYF